MSNCIFKEATFGYSLDFLVNGKYAGSRLLSLEEGESRQLGYEGREKAVLESDTVLTNRKVLKAGTEVIIETVPLQGRLNLQKDGK